MTINCGFCINLGLKTINHRVRDCPELAATECRYCHELGHTVSKCPKLGKSETNRKSTTDSRRKIVKGDDGWNSIQKPKSDTKKAFIRGKPTAAPKPASMTMADMIASKLPNSPTETSAYKGTFKNLGDVDLSERVEQGLKVTKPVALKGAWAAGRPKPAEVRPHQELRRRLCLRRNQAKGSTSAKGQHPNPKCLCLQAKTPVETTTLRRNCVKRPPSKV